MRRIWTTARRPRPDAGIGLGLPVIQVTVKGKQGKPGKSGKGAKQGGDPEVAPTRGAVLGAELNSYWIGLDRMNLGAAIFIPARTVWAVDSMASVVSTCRSAEKSR